MRKKEEGTILSQKEIVPGIFDLRLEAPDVAAEASAGQFVNLYLDDPARLLPRPISICGADPTEGTLRMVYRVSGPGTGTAELSRMEPGRTLSLMGPLGNGFPLGQAGEGRVFLIGGGIGIPPLLQAAGELLDLRGRSDHTDVILGYRDRNDFLAREFEPFGHVAIATEDGSLGTRGTVLDAIRAENLHADVIFACGPKPMLAAVARYAAEEAIPCWISMEERMACGIGACLACVCRTKETDGHSNVRNRRVCKDGPVFRADEIVF